MFQSCCLCNVPVMPCVLAMLAIILLAIGMSVSERMSMCLCIFLRMKMDDTCNMGIDMRQTCVQGFRPSKTQTNLVSYTD